MALRTIRTEGDEILRKRSKPVKELTPRTKDLIDDLIETVHDSNGVGLAAVQVGVLKRMCVVVVEDFPEVDEEGNEIPSNPLTHTNGEEIIIINPEVIPDESETQTGSEGCLSVPGKYGNVTRPWHVTLKALDRNLEPFEMEAEGLLARAICHECDHMDGVLYIDKVEDGLFDVEQVEEDAGEILEEISE